MRILVDKHIFKIYTKLSTKGVTKFMAKFKIDKDKVKSKTVNRTIRLKETTFSKLMQLSEESGVSFNKVVQECIEYSLSHM